MGSLPFIEGYEPVLPAFPELSGDEMMMSDEEDEPEKEIEEQSPGNGKGKGKAGQRPPKSSRGQDKVSNRVAARRHREMTKERLKNVCAGAHCDTDSMLTAVFDSSRNSARGSTMPSQSMKRVTECCRTTFSNCKRRTTLYVPLSRDPPIHLTLVSCSSNGT